MRKAAFVASAISLGAVVGVFPVIAAAEDNRGALTIAFENDLFGAGTDEHYSHGTEITYVSDTYQPDWLRSFAGGIGMYDQGDDLRVVWSLGQQMYTPSDLARTDLIVDDRPYAGWLYTSIGMFTDSQQRSRFRSINRLEFILGQVGPDSYAEDTQRQIHKITDSSEPRGWDNQLHNETTFDVQYQREWILPLVANYVDIVPRIGATVGTSQRHAGTGFTLRVGSGLNSDAGPPLIRPSATGSHYFKPNQSFYWYLFAGAHGRYVGHNIFLDGNSDGRSHEVEKNEWVGEVQGGAVMGWDAWRITLTEIYRSREFEGQDEPDEFGSIAVSYRF
ncbi:MAG: lipid A deacylase LpxR family protein [Spongiibacteraceae bacterium]